MDTETWQLANKLRGPGGIVDSRDFLESEGFTVVLELGGGLEEDYDLLEGFDDPRVPPPPRMKAIYYEVEPPRGWAKDGKGETGYTSFVVCDDRGRRRFRHLSYNDPTERWAYLEADPRDV